MPRLRRDRVTWLIYAQLAVWAYFLYGFSPIVVLLRDEQHVSRSVASLHSVAFAAGAVLAGAVFPPVARRLGRGTAMWLGLGGVMVGIGAFCAWRPIAATISTVFVTAVFGTLFLSGVVAALGERHGAAGPSAISEANALACGAGAIAPLLIGLTVHAGWTWRPAALVVDGLIVAVALVAFSLRVRIPGGSSHAAALDATVALPGAAGQDAPVGTYVGGRLPVGYWIAWILMSVTGSVEVCVNLWSGDLLRSHVGMRPGAAAAAVSGILGGMALGRLIGGRLALRMPAPQLLRYALALSGLGFVIFWTARVPWLAVVGLVVLGLGNAMHYPLGIAMALQVSGGRPDLASARASYGLAVSYGIAPFVLGAVADRLGTRTAFLLVPAFLIAAGLLVRPVAQRLATSYAPA